MENLSTKEFCRKFDACHASTKFALHYETMRDCYAALLAGEAGERSAGWAIWAATRPGVMSDPDLRLFAVRCARRVQHLMQDQRSVAVLDVAERYANGDATDAELSAASAAAWDAAAAAWDAAWSAWSASAAAWDAADAARSAAWNAAAAAWDAAWNAAAAWDAADAAWYEERKAQLDILEKFGNPFEVDHD